MRKLYSGTVLIFLSLSVPAQEVIWQIDIKWSTQDFFSQVATSGNKKSAIPRIHRIR